MNKKFPVPVLPGDRRRNNSLYREPEAPDNVLDPLYRRDPRGLIAYDPAFAHVVPSYLELRLDERNKPCFGLQAFQY